MDDGNQILLGTGIGKYSLYLFEAIKRAGIDITLAEQVQDSSGSRIKQRIKYIKTINSTNYQKYLENNYNVVLYTNYAIPLRKSKKVKYVGAIADMVAFLYPETLPTFYRLYNQIMIKNTIKNADLIFTISKSVEDEILERFPDVRERLVYTWLGLYDGIRPLLEYAPYENEKLQKIDDSPYFLFVSTVEKRKNVGLVIDAFIRLKRDNPSARDFKLVIVGRPGYGYEEFVEKVNSSQYQGDIIFSGFTSDADCNRLYNHAKAFVFPTIYEGFGFAQIECMKCHLPIILSDIPTNREISRNYGLFFDLGDISTLVKQMTVIVNGEYDYDRYNALADEYIKEFDWDRIARQYVDYIEALVK